MAEAENPAGAEQRTGRAKGAAYETKVNHLLEREREREREGERGRERERGEVGGGGDDGRERKGQGDARGREWG